MASTYAALRSILQESDSIDNSDNNENYVFSSDSDADQGELPNDPIGKSGNLQIENIGNANEASATAPTHVCRRFADPSQWKKNVRKKNRLYGLEYERVKKKYGQSAIFPSKTLRNVDCSKCKKKCDTKINQDQRQQIISSFYSLGSYERQQDYICQRVQEMPTEKRSTNKDKKKVSHKFSFIVGEDLIFVCKPFFLGTLSISEKRVRITLAKKSIAATYQGIHGNSRHEPINKTSEERKMKVHQHINSYPAVESHYIRKDSSKKYLPAGLNISIMYRHYIEFYGTTTTPVSAAIYRRIFKTDFNLAFHRPKKDQCQLCTKYRLMNATDKAQFQETYDEHIKCKERAREEKKKDKNRAADDLSFASISFDLESVLHTPCSAVSVMFYKRKFSVYNFTIFEQAMPHNGFCFIWTEVDAKRGSAEIATCLFTYLQRLSIAKTEISMFCDCCTGQNRNQFVAVAMLHAVRSLHLNVIEIKFLESGHTHMECDSMHSCIEQAKKYKNVYGPLDWLPIITEARHSNPFHITQLKGKDIIDWQSAASDIMPLRHLDNNQKKVMWTKIKVLRFEKASPSVISFKYDYDDEEFLRLKVKSYAITEERAYQSLLPISKAKKKDLVDLCKDGIIPGEYKTFYETLPTSVTVPDVLDESDIDDQTDGESEF